MIATRPPELSPAVFRLLADLVRRRVGFVVAESHRARLESRLAAEAQTAGSFYQLYASLRDEPTESAAFGRLLDASVNGETYFFRDPDGLRAFAEEIVPERLLAVGQDGEVLVWSAGCATGEEPYTLAMLLTERGLLPRRRIRIHGSDASPEAVRKAQAGVFGGHSLRVTSEDRRRAFFEATATGRFAVRPELRAVVTFAARPFALEPPFGEAYDVVLCRNVLMYLEPEARASAVSLFASRLKSGGYLLLGPSDVLAASSTPLTLVRLAHDVAYRK